MAGRGRTSFYKRQKEQVRLERRQQKVARKQERKAQKGTEPDVDTLDSLGRGPDGEVDPSVAEPAPKSES